MIALFSALLGFISSATPEFFKLFADSRDRAHEIALLKLQMEYDGKKLAAAHEAGEADRALRLQEIEIAAQMQESAALNARPGGGENKTGILWVDALAGSVRPVITYAFFVLYFVVKCCQFRLEVAALWTEEDIAIFSAVIGFWFGNRTMVKARRR